MNDFDAIIYDQHEQAWLCFNSPIYEITATNKDEVLPALAKIESLCRSEGLYAVGYLPYEAGVAFDERMSNFFISDLILLKFRLYNGYTKFKTLPTPDRSFSLGAFTPSVSRRTYDTAIDSVKQFIKKGYTYQVNFTFRMYNELIGDAYALFHSLTRSQGPGYSAFLRYPERTICSASPELFFTKIGDEITCKPMKGTIRRGINTEDDARLRETLRTSVKDQAENVMIVDMTRNDLGRVCEIGSVKVPKLFDIEKYPTVFQMTSTVKGTSEKSFPEIFKALFPCASITGAPKISTMNIIYQLESTPRGVYTGTIGIIKPNLDCQFNVAIRTAVIDNDTKKLTYAVGGGVVWDSTDSGEFDEALLKAEVITKPRPPFDLKESILWEQGIGYFLFDAHMNRLADSAVFFDYPLKLTKLSEQLHRLTKTFLPDQSYKIRVLLNNEGKIRIETSPIGSNPVPVTKLTFCPEPVDALDRSRYHKTTLLDAFAPPNALKDDFIYLNKDEQITETSIANIVVKIDGQLFTPPISAGILPGTYRAKLIQEGLLMERPIYRADLTRESEIYLINSVRKMWRAELAK